MKARIIKTGEEINIIGISKEWGTTQYLDRDGVYHQRNFNDGEIKILEPEENAIDWEQRRYELAKEAMNRILTAPVVAGVNPNPSVEDIAMLSVRLANALIKELKGDKE